MLGQKDFGATFFWVQTNWGSQKILGPKQFQSQKNVGSEKGNVWRSCPKRILHSESEPPTMSGTF